MARSSGMNFFIHSADIIAMKNSLHAGVAELRSALGGGAAGAGGAVNI
jgi:hypothetical protein